VVVTVIVPWLKIPPPMPPVPTLEFTSLLVIVARPPLAMPPAAGPRYRWSRRCVHVAIGDDERAAGAWRSAVPVAAGNAAPVGRGVAVDLAADDAESARAVQNPPLHRWGPSCRSPGCCFNRGRTGSTNGDRAGISAGDPAAAMAAVLPFTTESLSVRVA